MAGNDLKRFLGPRTAGRAIRRSLMALWQRRKPGPSGTAADCLTVQRLHTAELPPAERAMASATRPLTSR